MLKVLFALDAPQYHTVRLGEIHRFRGAALALDGKRIEAIAVDRDGQRLLETPVDLPCPEFAFLQVPFAASSRFEFDLLLDGTSPIELRGRREDGGEEPLFLFDLPFAREHRERTEQLAAAVRGYPIPESELVALTQGGGDREAYRESILSGLITTEAMLRSCGVNPHGIASVLDLGCGTGRLLTGWRAAGPARTLVGADINSTLIDWAARNLPDVADWHTIPPLPPLPLPSDSFDLALVASVFTHLPLAWQRAWVAELWRVLRPGGILLLTLHGETYAHLLLDPSMQESFTRTGYVEASEASEGANAYGTFHSTPFALEMLRPFQSIGFFPAGAVAGGVRSWFPVAAFQDVYLLRK
jgi:SAM-dependent methyltransferase